jgi:hypothetical protein
MLDRLMSFPSSIVRTLSDVNPPRDVHSVVRSCCHAGAWNRISTPGYQNHPPADINKTKHPLELQH